MLATVIKRLKNLPRDDSGVVMLETVLVFPIQILLMMTIIQIAHLYVVANVLQYAAYQAARTHMVNYHGDNKNEAALKGAQAAWVICSTINNNTGGTNYIRVPSNNYYYMTNAASGDRMSVKFSAYGDKGGYSSYSGAPDTIMYAEIKYKMDLVVPVGGPFVYQCLKAMGNEVSVNPVTQEGQATLEQNARLPKPWPH